MNDLISIIIPVYNNCTSIKKCLDSLINQSYKNLEIIIINDGSTDKTENVCLEYKENDKRIKYYFKKNSGVSDTRNYGIAKATGEYLCFIDSDDYIEKDYIEKLYNNLKATNAKIAISGFTKINEDGSNAEKRYYKTNKKVLKFEEYVDNFINYAYLTRVNMLIKKELLKNIKFESKLKYGEDILFTFELLKDNEMCYVPIFGYYYVQNSNSLTHQTTMEAAEKYMEDNNYVFSIFKRQFPNYLVLFNNRMLTKLNIALRKLMENPEIKLGNIKQFSKKVEYMIDYKQLKLKKINYMNKTDKIRLFFLKKHCYLLFYIFNKTLKMVKK